MTRPLTATARTQRPAPAPAHVTAGEAVLDRYRLEHRLGAGGCGVVWLGWDERLEREVAVKVIPGGDSRPEREARAAARLNHPGIVALYELAAGEHDTYLVSELVRGRTMAELEREGALADRDVARIGAAVCDALEHAHSRGVIHRDVKPQNVMVVAEPAAGAGFAKLTDFGVAQLANADPLTRTGDVVGTLAYMAPEQADGRAVTPACDVYSLALTLYEAWTGSNPVRARGPAATARRLGRPLPPLERGRKDLPPELCEAIDDALEVDPELRPEPAELAAALRDVAQGLDDEGGLVEPATLDRVGLERSPTPRPRLLLERLAAATGAGLLVLAAATLLGPEPPVAPLAAAGVAAFAAALLPRVGWLLGATATLVWLAADGRAGTALVLAAALAPVPLLLPRCGHLWSLPAVAPLLGAIGLAPAFPALAALAGTPLRRAGLGASGALWLVAGELVGGKSFLFGVADGTRPRAAWAGSVTDAAAHALYPVVSSPALAPALAWAGLAVLLPYVVRGRFLGLDLLAAAAWAALAVAVYAGLGDLLAATTVLDHARGAAAGALLGALAAVGITALRPPPVAEPGEPLTADGALP